MDATTRSAGRLIGAALAEAGVRLAFTVPGESFLPLLDGLVGAGIRVVATRHEGGAAFMGAAVGALTGRPAVVLATRAVGAANLAIGLHAAAADSVPLIALVGQVERAYRGREAFQEIDLVGSIGRLCRWSTEVRDVAGLPAALDEALRRAMNGRPGPVLLSLPEDVLEASVPADHARIATGPVLGPPRTPTPDPATVKRILRLLLGAERPIIVAGAGVLRSRSTADLVKLAELIDVPVIAAWRRPDAFPNDHPLYLGMSGYWAPATVRERLVAADALLVLGSRLNEVASFDYAVPAPGARWAHVDLEPLGARAGLAGPTISLVADARTFVREARRLLGGALLDKPSVDLRRERNVEDRAAFEAASVVDDLPWDGPGIHPGRTVATIGRILPPDAIVTTDAGHFGGWAARGLHFRRPGTFIGSTAGPMGFGLPAAIAASLVAPGRPVVALAGDGGFAMTMAELETAVREGAHPVVLVFDNARYGTIRDQQDRRGLAPIATDLGQVDFVRVAEGLGAEAIRVEDDAAFEPALRAALSIRRVALIHLIVDRRWVSVDRLATGDEPVVAMPEPAPAAVVTAEPEGEALEMLEPEVAPEAPTDMPTSETEVQAAPEAEAVASPEPEPETPAEPAEAAPAPEPETPEPAAEAELAPEPALEARSAAEVLAEAIAAREDAEAALAAVASGGGDVALPADPEPSAGPEAPDEAEDEPGP